MAKNTTKDAAMAADLKKRGERRTTMQCPICHGTISLTIAYGHIAFHK